MQEINLNSLQLFAILIYIFNFCQIIFKQIVFINYQQRKSTFSKVDEFAAKLAYI